MYYILSIFLIITIVLFLIYRKKIIQESFTILDILPLIISIHDSEKVYYISPKVEKLLGRKIYSIQDYLDMFDKKDKVEIIQILSDEKKGFYRESKREIYGRVYHIISKNIHIFNKNLYLRIYKDITDEEKLKKDLEHIKRNVDILDKIRKMTYSETHNIHGSMDIIFNYLSKSKIIDLYGYALEDEFYIYYQNKKVELKIEGELMEFLNKLKESMELYIENFQCCNFKSYFDIPKLSGYSFYINDHFIFFGKEGDISQHDRNILKSVAIHINYIIKYNEIIKQHELEKEYYKELATKDSLTQLYSRYYFNEWIIQHEEYIKRNDKKSVLVMIDINNFKKINDTYGHLEGDRVLRFVSKVIRKNIRNMDIAVRFGGDEILIVFPDAKIEDILKRMENINEKLKNGPFEFSLSLSYGLSFLDKNTSYLKALKEADEKMYKMKNGI